MRLSLDDLNLQSAVRAMCVEALDIAGSVKGAAAILKITRHSLQRRIEKLDIEWPPPESEEEQRHSAARSLMHGTIDMHDSLASLFIARCRDNRHRLPDEYRRTHFAWLSDEQIEVLERCVRDAFTLPLKQVEAAIAARKRR